MKTNLKDLLELQKKFSDACFKSKGISESQRIEKHKTFCLALHDEVSQLANAVHFKDHRQVLTPTDRQKVLYESIDILRYSLAMLNLWEFGPEEVEDAFMSRDAHLWDKKKRPLSSWNDQPVVIVDVDDVLARFREGFFDWLNRKFNLSLTPDIPEYYYSGPTGSLSGEEAFYSFIEEGGFKSLRANHQMISSLKRLRESGYWIQLLTARPSDNLKCMYDTYVWLNELKVPYDNIAFSFEKYRWLSDKPFFKDKTVVCAIDDSSKHAAEYASQGIKTLVPKRSYNTDVWEKDNIIAFDWENDKVDKIITDLAGRNSLNPQTSD